MNKLRPLYLTLVLLAGCAFHPQRKTEPAPPSEPIAPPVVVHDTVAVPGPRLVLELERPPRLVPPPKPAKPLPQPDAVAPADTARSDSTTAPSQARVKRVLAALAGVQTDVSSARRAAVQLGLAGPLPAGSARRLPPSADTAQQVCAGVLVQTWVGQDGLAHTRCRVLPQAPPQPATGRTLPTEYWGLLAIFVIIALFIFILTPKARPKC